jgi:cytoskeleton protein RodZ
MVILSEHRESKDSSPAPVRLSPTPLLTDHCPLTCPDQVDVADHFRRRLTPPDSSAYSPLQDPTPFLRERPPRQPLHGCTGIIKDRFRFMAKGNFGERLKREREMREVSLEELTKSTRISTRFLQALENESWDKLPGGVFGHGFVRTIARYLGLDEESLLGEYDLARAEKLQSELAKPEVRIPPPPKWIPVVAVFVVLLIALGLFYAGRYGWRRYAAHRAAKPSAASALSSRVPSQSNSSPGSSTLSGSSLDLSVSTSAATRVRILADNKLLLDTELPAGETRHFSANQQFEVTAGDSSAVLLELNGQAMPPLGAPGSSGTIVLSQKDLRQASGGSSQP